MKRSRYSDEIDKNAHAHFTQTIHGTCCVRPSGGGTKNSNRSIGLDLSPTDSTYPPTTTEGPTKPTKPPTQHGQSRVRFQFVIFSGPPSNLKGHWHGVVGTSYSKPSQTQMVLVKFGVTTFSEFARFALPTRAFATTLFSVRLTWPDQREAEVGLGFKDLTESDFRASNRFFCILKGRILCNEPLLIMEGNSKI